MDILYSRYKEMSMKEIILKHIEDYIEHYDGNQDPEHIIDHIKWLIKVGKGENNEFIS